MFEMYDLKKRSILFCSQQANRTLTVCSLLNEAQFTGSPVSGKADDVKVLSSWEPTSIMHMHQ